MDCSDNTDNNSNNGNPEEHSDFEVSDILNFVSISLYFIMLLY